MQASESSFYGWKLVAAVFFIYLVNTAFPYYGGSLLNAFMAEELALSRSSLGFGFSAFLLFVGLSSPAVGYLVNRLGVRLVLALGGAALTLGALAMATVTGSTLGYYVFFGGVCGLGFSLGGVIPVQSVITYWFRRRKPLAMSIVLCASGIGSMVAIPLLNAVIAGSSWRSGWYVVAVFCALSMAAALAFVRNRPEDYGQVPDGTPAVGSDAASSDAAPTARVYHTSELWRFADALRTRAYWLIVYATCVFTSVFNLCIAHGVVHLRDRGFADELTAGSVGLVVMASVIGRLGCGAIGTRVEPRLTWCAGLIVIVVGLHALYVAAAPWQLFLYAAGVGAGFGICYVSLATMVGNYFGTEAFAPLLGLLTTITCLVGALSPALAGITYDQHGSYDLAFQTLFILAAVGVIGIPFARPPRLAAPPDTATPGVETGP